MGMIDTQLATLIASRLCHDLISPIGAINNGLELLGMSGNADGPEIKLISQSVGNASARIRFFRIAFGAASDQMVGPGEVLSILKDQYENSRLAIEWQPAEPVLRSEVRMAFLAILCAETAMPYGGQIHISNKKDIWQLQGVADRISLDKELWSLLQGAIAPIDLMPSQVEFALLPLIVQDAGRNITCKGDATQLSLTF